MTCWWCGHDLLDNGQSLHVVGNDPPEVRVHTGRQTNVDGRRVCMKPGTDDDPYE